MPQTQLSKEQSIERCVRFINGKPGLPAFAHHMAEIARAMENESSSLNLLTNLILKNVSLTTAILRAANSIYYNAGAKPILSVSRAVTRMGWDSIGNLATGVLIFEHFRNQSVKLRELVLHMVLTGNHARQIAIRCGMRGIEEAYLCGMFRNLGELVVACYLPDEYARIDQGMKEGLSAAESCQRALRFGYEDLGKGMARQWNLPEAVASCMDAPDLSGIHTDGIERLRIISSFSHALCLVVYRTSASKSRDALKALIKQYGPGLPVKESEIPAILEAAVLETDDTLRLARLPVDRVVLSRQIIAATNVATELAVDRQHAFCEIGTPVYAGNSDVLKNLMSELQGILHGEEDFDLNGALMMILEAMYRGLGLDRALFCVVDDTQENVRAQFGVGADVEPLVEKFDFPISMRSGPIGLAMLGREDLIVEAGGGARYQRSVFMSVVGSPNFGILPLVVDGVAAGCLYFDSASEAFTLSDSQKQALQALRNLAGLAITRKGKPTK